MSVKERKKGTAQTLFNLGGINSQESASQEGSQPHEHQDATPYNGIMVPAAAGEGRTEETRSNKIQNVGGRAGLHDEGGRPPHRLVNGGRRVISSTIIGSGGMPGVARKDTNVNGQTVLHISPPLSLEGSQTGGPRKEREKERGAGGSEWIRVTKTRRGGGSNVDEGKEDTTPPASLSVPNPPISLPFSDEGEVDEARRASRLEVTQEGQWTHTKSIVFLVFVFVFLLFLTPFFSQEGGRRVHQQGITPRKDLLERGGVVLS